MKVMFQCWNPKLLNQKDTCNEKDAKNGARVKSVTLTAMTAEL